MLNEFKKFVSRGNVVDMAVGIIIGAAFGGVVSSLVNDIIMPPIGWALQGVNFKDLFYVLNGQHFKSMDEAKAAGAPAIFYGNFINTFIDFLIVALVIFLLIRAINKLKQPPKSESPATKDCPYCKTTIPFAAVKCPNCTSDIKGG